MESWRLRARENLAAAVSLAGTEPPSVHAAVSRIYYALFQAVCRVLLAKDLGRPGGDHGAVWRAADTFQAGLYGQLQDLYSWRRKADYATGHVPVQTARQLVADYSQLTRDLCNL